jgi:large subunit ribosomal protein L25
MATFKATTRGELGSRPVRLLRKKGMVPGVIYGHGKPTVPVTLDQHDVDRAIHHGERVLELELEGDTVNCLIKDVQWDTFGQELLHVDLTRVNLDERVEVAVPVILRGTPAGASEGGVLQQVASEVNIECTVRSIPEEIRVLVTGLKLGDALHARDIELPEGAKLLDEPEAMVCTVSVIEEAPEPEEETESAEPEVIGGKPEEEAGEESD